MINFLPVIGSFAVVSKGELDDAFVDLGGPLGEVAEEAVEFFEAGEGGVARGGFGGGESVPGGVEVLEVVAELLAGGGELVLELGEGGDVFLGAFKEGDVEEGGGGGDSWVLELEIFLPLRRRMSDPLPYTRTQKPEKIPNMKTNSPSGICARRLFPCAM